MALIKNCSLGLGYFFILVLFIYSCTPGGQAKLAEQENLMKVNFDLSILNDDGLYGPKEGLRALDYEFCIPMEETKKVEVKKIDASIRFFDKAKGRIGCSANEYLCIGSTHQKKHKKVLTKLAALDYIKRIDQVFYE